MVVLAYKREHMITNEYTEKWWQHNWTDRKNGFFSARTHGCILTQLINASPVTPFGPGDIGASQRCRRNRRCRGHIMETQNEGLENQDRVAKFIFWCFGFINLWFIFRFSDVPKQYIFVAKKQTFGEPESTPMNFLFGFQIPMTTFRLMRRTGRLVTQRSAVSGPCHS